MKNNLTNRKLQRIPAVRFSSKPSSSAIPIRILVFATPRKTNKNNIDTANKENIFFIGGFCDIAYELIVDLKYFKVSIN